MNVLIADDAPVTRALLRASLERAGLNVLEAANGLEALSLVRRGAARLVITDWEMPGMSGVDLCRAIRNDEQPGYVYIILLTAHGLPEERVAGLSAGADDFVSKPFDPAELVARVRAGERVLSLETRDVAIFALARLAESRDPETGAHLERVQSYCRVLTQDLAAQGLYPDEIDAEFIRLIHLTSPLHDIGKVGVPDRVLLKPGKLTPEEFEVMKTHTVVGASTLDAAVDRFPGVKFLRMARDIARSHHERFDGGGYPDGLAGQAIPLCARIVAVADVYDALTSRRVYKPAFSHERARAIIREESGKHLDPDVTAAFARNEARFLEVRARFLEYVPAAA